ncbi:hypothetical protein NM688_g5293 [Phlebia brevispora]|uniref:Uncharacterized protein n=1 Tax=Phlebia brevispora TaxID=194682 RepID=A0ACC1SXX6_9APHY|nr:hypothetical protein NM688_g5293 [Phlebia brevispora]
MLKRPIGLVEYASSEEGSGDERPPQKVESKKRKLPPLSPSVTIPTPVDNPALHQGRKRTIPHVDGQYASYVYIPLRLSRSSPLYNFLRDVLSTARAAVPSLHPIGVDAAADPVNPNPELRISLTRPIYLRAHQREEFKSAVRAVARRSQQFTASFAQFAELVNDERTRTFLTLEVGAGHLEFKALSDALVPILDTFRQELYYKAPRFHASIAWALLSSPSGDTSQQAGQQNRTQKTQPTQNPDLAAHPSPSPKPKEAPLPNSEAMIGDTNSPFPTIPCLPQEMIQVLQQQYGSMLLSRHIGVFDVDEICIRIGKDVTRWRLGER